MSYSISKSNNEILITLPDGQIDVSSTPLTLVGKNVSNFGDAQNENFIHLLENFANSSSNVGGSGQPKNPLKGQLWFDTNPLVNRLMMYDGSHWRPLAVTIVGTTSTNSIINSSAVPPIPIAASQPGDFFYNTTDKKLYIIGSTSSEKILIGPESVPNFGTTKLESVSVFDDSNISKPIIKVVIDNEVIAIISSSTFNLSTESTINGFNVVYRGITFKNYDPNVFLSTSTSDVVLYGLHKQLDEYYTRSDMDQTITSDWKFSNNREVRFGNSNNGYIKWNDLSNRLELVSNNVLELKNSALSISLQGQSLVASTNTFILGATTVPIASAYIRALSPGSNGSIGTLEGTWNLLPAGNISPQLDLTASLGGVTNRFSSVFSRALSAGGSNNSAVLEGQWALTTASTILPIANNACDLGSETLKFGSIYTSKISGLTEIEGNLSVQGNLIPGNNDSFNIGDINNPWPNVYADLVTSNSSEIGTLNVSGQSTLNNSNISNLSANNIQATSANLTNLTVNSATISSSLISNANISVADCITSNIVTANVDVLNSKQSTLTTASASTLFVNVGIFTSTIITSANINSLQVSQINGTTISAPIINVGGNRVLSEFSTGNTGLLNTSPTPGRVELTGILNVEYGGSGRSFFGSGYLKASGSDPFTVSPTIPWSDISDKPGDSLPSGTRLLFAMATPPVGWTKETNSSYNDRALRVVTGTGAGLGGSMNFTSAFTSRTFTGTVATATSNISLSVTNVRGVENEQSQWDVYRYQITDPGHTHPVSQLSADFSVKYVDVIIATKD